LRAPRKLGRRVAAAPTLSVRLVGHVTFDVQASGHAVAQVQGFSVGLGKLSAAAAERARQLRTGFPLAAFASARRPVEKEIHHLVRRLAARGLVEYRLAATRGGGDQVVIEPQMPDYWPRTPRLRGSDRLVLSRFAYLRRRAYELVLESPRSGALFKISDAKVAGILAALATPHRIEHLRRRPGFPGLPLLALLVDCEILFRVAASDAGLRPTEGDDSLVMWDFHDLLFHARSTEGRHANPSGGIYPYAGAIAELPAVRPRWPGEAIDLRPPSAAAAGPSPMAELLQKRHSTRDFDDRSPITLAELAQFLDVAARVRSEQSTTLDLGGGDLSSTYALRLYPSAGAGYELELYLAVDRCEGLPRGFYHYDAGAHAVTPIEVRGAELDAALDAATVAMGATSRPQILITIAARFGRLSWKYSSIAYGLILKDVGVLLQTFYLMATDIGLGGCAVGSTNIQLFARMTGIDFHVEGAVGQFALGRGAAPARSD